MINTSAVSPSQLLQILKDSMNLSMVPMIWGPPGAGKTQTVHQLAQDLDLPLKIVHLVAHDVADLGGAPAHDHDAKRMINYPSDLWPRVDRDGPAGILFLDEVSYVNEDVEKILLRLLLERTIGDYTLPEGWRPICAGNRPEDVMDAHEFNPAVSDRLMHLILQPNIDSFLQYGVDHGLHSNVLAFLKTRPQFLTPSEQQVKSGFSVLPSPRSWERVSDVMKIMEGSPALQYAISGIVGDAIAAEFILLADKLAKMASIKQILETEATPQALQYVIPDTLEGLWALAYAFESVINSEKVLKRVIRRVALYDELPLQMQKGLPMKEVMTLTSTMILNKAIKMDLDCSEDPGFIKLDEKRRADERSRSRPR